MNYADHLSNYSMESDGSGPNELVVPRMHPNRIRNSRGGMDLPLRSLLGPLGCYLCMGLLDDRQCRCGSHHCFTCCDTDEHTTTAPTRLHYCSSTIADCCNDCCFRHRGRRLVTTHMPYDYTLISIFTSRSCKSPTRSSKRSRDVDCILHHVGSLSSIRHVSAGHVLPAPSSSQAPPSRNRSILLPSNGSSRHGRIHHHVPRERQPNHLPPSRLLPQRHHSWRHLLHQRDIHCSDHVGVWAFVALLRACYLS